MSEPLKSILITDLDNTLYDWVHLWVRCFSAMFSRIVEISNIDPDVLKKEIRQVHQKHGTSEYSFLIEELPSVRSKFPGEKLLDRFQPAINAFREQRRHHLKLYPSVAETLLKIKGSGAKVVGYTESMAFYSNYRVRRLGLDGVLDFVFSPADHDIPAGLSKDDIRRYPAANYKFKYTVHEHTPPGQLKPNVGVLSDIIQKIGATTEQCVYVGDSLMKDVAMAHQLGVANAWAEYGAAQHTPGYELLREVTHWTPEEVEREKRILEQPKLPAVALNRNFGEILNHFQFGVNNGS
jgi:FMN phosphatase YigB (HAD superfamily)